MWGYGNMMGWGGYGGGDILGIIFWVIAVVDLVLAGFWLWKQVNRK